MGPMHEILAAAAGAGGHQVMGGPGGPGSGGGGGPMHVSGGVPGGFPGGGGHSGGGVMQSVPPGPPGGPITCRSHNLQGPNGMLYFPGPPPHGHGPPLPVLHLPNGASANQIPSRLERLRRWKEKRKNRNFNKTIRYQSRKVCADNRPRIKGKFVKVGSTPDLGALVGRGEDDEDDDDEEEEDSFESEGAPPPGALARTAGLRRTGGLTAAMSVPDLTMMSRGLNRMDSGPSM